MRSEINQLVSMRDVQSLYEIMTEDEEWLNQMDAAEGLVKLGDRRGYEFLVTAIQSDDEEILEAAQEILDSPEVARMQAEIEAEQKRRHAERVQSAKKRLLDGGKVFRYKMVYIPASALMSQDLPGEGYAVPDLEELGLEGWEMVHMLPSRRNILAGRQEFDFTGAYFLFKQEVLPGELDG